MSERNFDSPYLPPPADIYVEGILGKVRSAGNFLPTYAGLVDDLIASQGVEHIYHTQAALCRTLLGHAMDGIPLYSQAADLLLIMLYKEVPLDTATQILKHLSAQFAADDERLKHSLARQADRAAGQLRQVFENMVNTLT